MQFLISLVRSSIVWALLMVLAALTAIDAFGGLIGLTGGGLLVKTATAISAAIMTMLILWGWTWLRGQVNPKDPANAAIKKDPMALAIQRVGYVIAAALICALVYGCSAARAADRFAACAPYEDEIADAVATYWGAFQYPAAWEAQIYQESLCDPLAVSPVGAAGLAQFMPATAREVGAQLGLTGGWVHTDVAIEAGAFYMARLSGGWTSPRPALERHRLAQASYNAGFGNILKAQRACGGARDWAQIQLCLPQVTGHHAAETRAYVRRIERWWRELAAGDPLAAPPALAAQWRLACSSA